MQVTFWGVRGSIPCPLSPADMRSYQRVLLREVRLRGLPAEADEDRFIASLPPPASGLVGGNTSCVEVNIEQQTLIFDAGSGLRLLGHRLMNGPCGQGRGSLKIFISHTHWDHIQGLPYFQPFYVPGNRIQIFSGFKNIAERLDQQQRSEFFPVPISELDAEISCHFLPENKTYVLSPRDGFPPRSRIILHKLSHPGGAHGFRLETRNAVLVYAADADYSSLTDEDLKGYFSFFHKADLLIFDAQFTFQESISRREWGHASAIMGVNIAQQAGVRQLALFHHSIDYPDQYLYEMLEEALAYRRVYFPETQLKIFLATEGQSLTLGS